MKNLVSQSEFARLKGVSRKTVSEWRAEQRLVFSGKLVDVAATQQRLLDQSTSKARGMRAPVTLASTPVVGDTPVYAPGVTYDNPANLPDEVTSASAMIEGGAYEMARLIRPRLPLAEVKTLVAAWVQSMRDGIVGGPGLPDAVADCHWPGPPVALGHWREHPYFQADPLSAAEWEEIEAEAP